jgi:hypothetical protein
VTSLVEFSNLVLSEMEEGLQVDAVYPDFSKVLDRSYTARSRVDDYLSETIYCHSGVPPGSHLGPLFFIADINDVLDIF